MTIFDHLATNTTILTPNSRLSAALQRQYQQQQLANAHTCWQKLDALPITSWLERLWNELTSSAITDFPLLLKTNQEKILWEKIITNTPAYDYLLQKTATADLAKAASDILTNWQVEIENPDIAITEDGHAFQQWAREYATLTKTKSLLARNALPEKIHQAILANKIRLPKRLVLIGFTEISPQLKNLLTLCEEKKCEVIYYQTATPANTLQKIALTDEEHEIRTMARWAKALYDQNKTMQPYTIGCVILNLDKLRNKVQQIFCETFAENHSFTFDNSTLPFNITAGRYLIDYPVIHTAFELLPLANKEVSLEKFSNVLRSPFLGDAETEQAHRCHLEIRLRKTNAASISLRELLERNSLYKFSHSCPKLAGRAQLFLEYAQQLRETLLPSEWIHHLLQMLKILGWPGERSINSAEYQTIERWLQVLNEFTTYDHILGPLTFNEALYQLNQLTAKDVYQIKTEEAPIQVLGMFEAVELSFEHLWVMGLDDTVWPPAPKPNPLIPLRLQKRLNMPHSTTEREFLYSRELMRQIKHSAKQIIFSHAIKREDAELQPSPLLSDIPEIKLESLELSEFISPAEQIFQKKKLEYCIDAKAPALSPEEEIRGGTRIFKLQAACPFRAFAEIRLHARHLEVPSMGLRALDRGNIIHKALELTWRIIRSSNNLLTLQEDELSKIIEQAIEQAIQLNLTQHQDKQRYIALEKHRLKKLLHDWLQIEKARTPFKVIKQEYERQLTMGDIALVVRVDRIDELEDGRHLIIDYKTGKNNFLQSWFGERPDEPQLPLYCVTDEEETIAIAFAQLNTSDMKYIGVSQVDIGIPSIKLLAETKCADQGIWTHQVEEWQKVLEKLASDFANGIATVNPKKNEETCQLCNLLPLCRIHEKV